MGCEAAPKKRRRLRNRTEESSLATFNLFDYYD